MSFFGTLFLAWFLTLFNLDNILISALNEVFGTNLSTNIYWLIAFIIAIIPTSIEITYYEKNNKKKH